MPIPERLRPTDRTTIGRHPERGTDDRAVAHAILDEGLVCHVGLTADPAGKAEDEIRSVSVPGSGASCSSP